MIFVCCPTIACTPASRTRLCQASGFAAAYGLNIGSTVRGIWENEFSDNTIIGLGILLSNVNGTICNNRILNNQVTDGSIFADSGLDFDKVPGNRVNRTTCPTGHGVTLVRGNTTSGDISSAAIVLRGLESYVAEGNRTISKSSRCNLGARLNQLCQRDSDCPGGYCSVNTVGIHLAGSVQLTSWTPGAAHPQYDYVLPSLPNGWMYSNLGKAGTAGKAEPAWCAAPDCTVSDGGMLWTNRGPAKRATLNDTSITVEKPPETKNPDAYNLIAYLGGLPRSLAEINGFRVSVPYVWQFSGFGTNYDDANEPPAVKIRPGTVYGEPDRQWSGTTPPNYGRWKQGVHVWRTDGDKSFPGWEVTTAGWAAPSWKASQACPFGLYIVPDSPNGHFYRAINPSPGKSAGSQPQWPRSFRRAGSGRPESVRPGRAHFKI